MTTMETIRKGLDNIPYDNFTFQGMIDAKQLTDEKINKEFIKLVKMPTDKLKRTFCCNKILYHYQFRELLSTRRDVKNYKTLKEIFDDPAQKKYWIDMTFKINRRDKLEHISIIDVFEGYRRCKGSINFFKAFTTKYLMDKYNGTHLLDPTAGWGGRLLGARSLNAEYTGIDTNINLKPGYDKMIEKFGGNMIWGSCLDVDFSTIDYDIVITSPPYINLEKYSHMPLFGSKENYYKEFLIPLINKSKQHIKRNGKVIINISDYMYDDYIIYGGIPCLERFDMLQQMGGKKNKEVIYVF